MADVDTQLLSSQHSDIRLEQQKQSFDLSRQMGDNVNEVVKEGLKGDYTTQKGIYDATANLSQQIDRIDDTTMAQFFTVARDTADLRAQVAQAIATADKAAEMNALKVQLDAAKNTTYLSDKIGGDGEKTRALLIDFRDRELNRLLIERNAEIVDERHHGRFWRGNYDNAQYAALTSQLNAFQSQLQETRQGMVNFGTMAGVGQSSTSNNVR